MSHCPVPGCDRALGTTRYGDPFAFCPAHYHRLNHAQRQKLWQAYRAWRRLEKRYLSLPASERRGAVLLNARAVAIKAYLEIRDDCIRLVTDAGRRQLEVAL